MHSTEVAAAACCVASEHGNATRSAALVKMMPNSKFKFTSLASSVRIYQRVDITDHFQFPVDAIDIMPKSMSNFVCVPCFVQKRQQYGRG